MYSSLGLSAYEKIIKHYNCRDLSLFSNYVQRQEMLLYAIRL